MYLVKVGEKVTADGFLRTHGPMLLSLILEQKKIPGRAAPMAIEAQDCKYSIDSLPDKSSGASKQLMRPVEVLGRILEEIRHPDLAKYIIKPSELPQLIKKVERAEDYIKAVTTVCANAFDKKAAFECSNNSNETDGKFKISDITCQIGSDTVLTFKLSSPTLSKIIHVAAERMLEILSPQLYQAVKAALDSEVDCWETAKGTKLNHNHDSFVCYEDSVSEIHLSPTYDKHANIDMFLDHSQSKSDTGQLDVLPTDGFAVSNKENSLSRQPAARKDEVAPFRAKRIKLKIEKVVDLTQPVQLPREVEEKKEGPMPPSKATSEKQMDMIECDLSNSEGVKLMIASEAKFASFLNSLIRHSNVDHIEKSPKKELYSYMERIFLQQNKRFIVQLTSLCQLTLYHNDESILQVTVPEQKSAFKFLCKHLRQKILMKLYPNKQVSEN